MVLLFMTLASKIMPPPPTPPKMSKSLCPETTKMLQRNVKVANQLTLNREIFLGYLCWFNVIFYKGSCKSGRGR